jgi:hypothetical protein
MQRRDPRSFLEHVLSQVPDLSAEAKEKLAELTEEKAGTKRAARIAAILQQDEARRGG